MCLIFSISPPLPGGSAGQGGHGSSSHPMLSLCRCVGTIAEQTSGLFPACPAHASRTSFQLLFLPRTMPVLLLADHCLPLRLAGENNQNYPKQTEARQSSQCGSSPQNLGVWPSCTPPVVSQTALQKMVVLCVSLQGVAPLCGSWAFSGWAGRSTFLTCTPAILILHPLNLTLCPARKNLSGPSSAPLC